VTSILDIARDIDLATGKGPLTPRWEATLRAFYGLELRQVDLANLAAGNARLGAARGPFRELWARVGRRGRKSFTMALLAVFEAIFGGHERFLVAGERGLVAVVSKDTAGSILVARFCELHALALGLATSWTSMGSIRILEIEGIPFGIACFPCNAKAPRGYAMPVIIADEPAHWATESEFVNSDEMVLGAIKPAMAQFPDAKLVAISSPLGKLGLHYDTVERNLGRSAEPDLGPPDADVLAVEGPTWEWNPDISEARTHELEKDPRVHAREYGGVPGAGVIADWFGSALDRAVEPLPDAPLVVRPTAAPVVFHSSVCMAERAGSFLHGLPLGCDCALAAAERAGSDPFLEGVRYTIGVDQAFQHDKFAWAVISSQLGEWNPEIQKRGPRITRVHDVGAWKPDRSPREMLRRLLNEVCRRYHTNRIFIDQHGGIAVLELCSDVGLSAQIIPWTGGDGETSKATRYRAVRIAMLEGVFKIPNEPDLLREFRMVQGALLPSGGERISVPRTALGHGDRVSATVLAGSIALAHSPDLAVGRETEWERREREQAGINLALALC
jgi:hypothetical protein